MEKDRSERVTQKLSKWMKKSEDENLFRYMLKGYVFCFGCCIIHFCSSVIFYNYLSLIEGAIASARLEDADATAKFAGVCARVVKSGGIHLFILLITILLKIRRKQVHRRRDDIQP